MNIVEVYCSLHGVRPPSSPRLLLLSVIPTSGEFVTAVISAMFEEGTLDGRPERIVTYKFMNTGDAGILPCARRPRDRSARALGVHGMLLNGQIAGGLISPGVGCHTVAAFLADAVREVAQAVTVPRRVIEKPVCQDDGMLNRSFVWCETFSGSGGAPTGAPKWLPYKLSEITRLSVPSFASEFQAPPEQLPAVVILVKYCEDSIVVPVRGTTDFPAFLQFFQTVSKAVRNYKDTCAVPSHWYEATAAMAGLALEAERRIDECSTALWRRVDVFFRETPDVRPLGENLRNLLTDPRGFDVAVVRQTWEQLLKGIADSGHTKALNHAPGARVQRYLETISECQTIIRRVIQDGDTIEARFKRIKHARQKLEDDLRAIASHKIGSFVALPGLMRSKTILNKFTTCLLAIERLVRVLVRLRGDIDGL